MKQQITVEQLNECSKPRKLATWMDKRHYGLLPTIGQMIEFLDENTKHEFHIFRRLVDWKIIYEDLYYGKILGEELCDSLWKAVKEKLET